MNPRVPFPVLGRTALVERQLHCWGRTSGGASPTLDTPSWGSSSITDVAVGLLDVTMERAAGSANYVIGLCIQSTTANVAFGIADSTTAATSTVFRLSAWNTTSRTDPTVGYHWLVTST